ncbi:MAG: ABC transporter ATP-binding protein [Methanomassiliicoccales archaeon]
MIEFQQVTKIYNRRSPPAVQSLDLSVRNGEILGLVGLNGAGKTSSIRMAAGILLPTTGRILVDGHDIVEEKVEAAKGIGWIPELPNFEPNAKPVPLMKYFAGFYGLSGKEADEQVMRLLNQVGLAPHLQKKLRAYSQGMKKRFSIAESLIGNPSSVMFDETLNGLDPEGVLFVRNLIIELKKQGKAVLLSSHILSEIQDIADRVAIIHQGRLIKLLDRSEMQTLGNWVLHLNIKNMDDRCGKLLSKYGEVRISGNDCTVTDIKIQYDEIPSIADELIKEGYKIIRFYPVGESLEEYFFRVIGGKE